MHGMLSLAVLVAAFAGLAGWVGCLMVRLYRACPAARTSAALPPTPGPARPHEGGGSAGEHAEEHVATPRSVA